MPPEGMHVEQRRMNGQPVGHLVVTESECIRKGVFVFADAELHAVASREERIVNFIAG